MMETSPQASKHPRFVFPAAAACLFAVFYFMHRELFHTAVDYLLLAGFCGGAMLFTAICVWLRGFFHAWSLVAQAFLFAGTLLLIIIASKLLGWLVGTPLALKLFDGALPLAALIPPTVWVFFGSFPAQEKADNAEPTAR